MSLYSDDLLNAGFGRAGLFVDLTSNQNHTLYIDGLLNDGRVVSRSRSFYTGKNVCNVYVHGKLCTSYTFMNH